MRRAERVENRRMAIFDELPGPPAGLHATRNEVPPARAAGRLHHANTTPRPITMAAARLTVACAEHLLCCAHTGCLARLLVRGEAAPENAGMRLWSLHPRHLDARGLLALWPRIRCRPARTRLPVSRGQLAWELVHLRAKLWRRDRAAYRRLPAACRSAHPLIAVRGGAVEHWERRR